MRGRETVKARVVEYCRRRKAPILIGMVHMEARVVGTLDEVEGLLDELVEDGVLQKFNGSEAQRRFGVHCAYALV
jgi:hypothetical protein